MTVICHSDLFQNVVKSLVGDSIIFWANNHYKGKGEMYCLVVYLHKIIVFIFLL